jgi:hypothetical protein
MCIYINIYTNIYVDMDEPVAGSGGGAEESGEEVEVCTYIHISIYMDD